MADAHQIQKQVAEKNKRDILLGKLAAESRSRSRSPRFTKMNGHRTEAVVAMFAIPNIGGNKKRDKQSTEVEAEFASNVLRNKNYEIFFCFTFSIVSNICNSQSFEISKNHKTVQQFTRR